MIAAVATPTHVPPASWTYASGLVSALEGRLLTLGATADMLNAEEPDELLGRLRQTLLLADLAESTEPFALAESIEACCAGFVATFAEACPVRTVADLFLRLIDWRAFRSFLRVQVLDTQPHSVAGSLVPEGVWQQCWMGSDVEPEFELFALAAEAVRAAMPREERDQRLVDEMTAIGQTRDLMRLARQSGSEAIADWVASYLKPGLALALLRCRRNGWGHVRTADALDDLGVSKYEIAALMSPDGQDWRRILAGLGLAAAEALGEGTPLAVIERLIDDAMTETVQAARGIPFGPEPVFAFLWGARTEALNLRLVGAGLAAGLPRDIVAGDLRQTYV